MINFISIRPRSVLLSLAASLTALICISAAPKPGLAQNKLYNPIPLQTGNQISDRLSSQDIPTGKGGFARDYTVSLAVGDQLVIDVLSEDFDTIVALIDTANGTTIAENDDGPDGSTNSLLFTRITKAGTYIVRVQAFGETIGGSFKLKVTRLKPI
jgi:hypothetical protein